MTNPHEKATKPSTIARLLAWLGFTTPGHANGFTAATLDRPTAVPKQDAVPPQAPSPPVVDAMTSPGRRRPLADDAHGNELRREIATLEAQLKTELTPAQLRLVDRLTDAQGALDNAEHTGELDRHAEALARHFGTLAPLIRALHWHLVEETAGRDVDECGLFPDLRTSPAKVRINKCLGFSLDADPSNNDEPPPAA